MWKINKSFPPYKYIKNMILTNEPLIKTTTNKVKRKEVVVGETDNNFYHIKSGIEIGETVIKEADMNLKDGDKIKISDSKAKNNNNKKGSGGGNRRTPGAPRPPM